MDMQRSGPPVPAPAGAVTGFLGGVRLLGRGIALYGRSPRMVLVGLIPVVITATLFVAALLGLGVVIDDIAGAVTPFADDWSEAGRTTARLLAGLLVFGVALLLAVVTFTAVALIIGEPFFEWISERVEEWCGGAPPEVERGWWRSFGQSLRDSAVVVAVTAAIGIGLFAAGFIPVAGQTVVPVLGALVGGWFLAVELVGIPFSRRGLRLRDRRRALRARRSTALGFGTAVFVCFLIPGVALLLMPAAVAGGTLLARAALGLPHRPH